MGADLSAAVQFLCKERDALSEQGVTTDAATRTIKTRAALARNGVCVGCALLLQSACQRADLTGMFSAAAAAHISEQAESAAGREHSGSSSDEDDSTGGGWDPGSARKEGLSTRQGRSKGADKRRLVRP
jgi:hypothetical protein